MLQKVYATYTHREVVDCKSTQKNLIVSVGTPQFGSKLLFTTTEGPEIVELIRDYHSWLDIPLISSENMELLDKSCDILVTSEPHHVKSCDLSSKPSCSKDLDSSEV